MCDLFKFIDLMRNVVMMIYLPSQVNVKTQVVVGDPKYKICETVENLHADLLVIGSRAHGRIKRYQQSLLPHTVVTCLCGGKLMKATNQKSNGV